MLACAKQTRMDHWTSPLTQSLPPVLYPSCWRRWLAAHSRSGVASAVKAAPRPEALLPLAVFPASRQQALIEPIPALICITRREGIVAALNRHASFSWSQSVVLYQAVTSNPSLHRRRHVCSLEDAGMLTAYSVPAWVQILPIRPYEVLLGNFSQLDWDEDKQAASSDTEWRSCSCFLLYLRRLIISWCSPASAIKRCPHTAPSGCLPLRMALLSCL
ncbi:hypothetical protein K469DRAFT_295822 [Zopfia rhizophila CBS 207.26]|uniref:Uncharacterized protein n=1 Tax=Zopfia rhizophila CBS 207.26 TaxID=1314779 RepID=A0A6A6DJT1_9PEZI|nr:hypothetical protein K469DRAFT_295822 [Zopfia rhizophila CBS 207.26]